MAERVKLEGVAELKRALEELGKEVSTRIGRRANRAAAKVVEKAVVAAAPVGRDPASKYGRLRDNIRITKRKTTKATEIRHIVHTGNAFWGRYLEFGTVKMSATPFFRRAWEGVQNEAVATQITVLRAGIEREAKRLAKGGRAGPPVEE